MKKLFSHIKHRMISGLLLTIPLIITYIIVTKLFEAVDSLSAKYIHQFFGEFVPGYKPFPGIGVVVSLVIIYIIGMLGSSVIIRKLIALGERILTKIPLIKEIYTSVKQLIDAFKVTSSGSFRQAVYVEYPKENVYVLGFQTNEFEGKDGKRFSSVFIPTTPNPTSGYLLFYPVEDVIPAGKSVDDAFKAIMSGAIIFDGTLPLGKAGVAQEAAEIIDVKDLRETGE